MEHVQKSITFHKTLYAIVPLKPCFSEPPSNLNPDFGESNIQLLNILAPGWHPD